MSKPIIEIENVGKRYRIGGQRERYLSLRDELAKRLSPTRRRAEKDKRDFWALRDVSFSVNQGEAVAIVGRNGAGKSTLLKVLSRITPPTEGRIRMHGRVASLLEVGTGFHPELTGRENIFLNGTILGMTRREVARKFDEIVEFAEVQKFLDTPVKRYSSGMYVRLAFAVAAHLEPEILVVDEVLAVGDAEFQKKCLGKMGEVAQGGRTVLFVSHNMAAVRSLCRRGILLEAGSVVAAGTAAEVAYKYAESREQGLAPRRDLRSATRNAGSGAVRYTESEVADVHGRPRTSFAVGEPIQLRFDLECEGTAVPASLWVLVADSRGETVFSSFEYDSLGADTVTSGPGSFPAGVTLDPNPLAPGTYTVAAGAFGPGREFLDWVNVAASFRVENAFAGGRAFDSRLGLTTLPCIWTRRVEPDCEERR